ncbi:MAG: FTR1 family iron permease [Deltaproteobacteria bacterium]|jgi:high-affinity iron transporter|nr:FTR1 family iron permease [Deltaproteobacteria bacterium]
MKKTILGLVAAFLLTTPVSGAFAQSQYSSWSEVAAAMVDPLNKAYDSYAIGGNWEEARDFVNVAYFDFYEKEGFERMVMNSVSGKRAKTVEFKFATIKTGLKAGKDPAVIKKDIDTLITWLLEDGEALDLKFGITASATGTGGAAASSAGTDGASAAADASGDQGSRGLSSFLMALGTILREGVEAILVIAAMAAYLRRSGHKSKVKVVYNSAIGAVVFSFAAALALDAIFSMNLQKQEILEGITMLLATVVLFGVSNWMFAKAEAEAWKKYIQSKVEAAATTGSAFALGAAAFLAVFREGAETILFFKSIFAQAGADSTMIWLGFGVGCVGLAIIFAVIRVGTMVIPLKPFFVVTSILMFVMAISFAGGGIAELQEADVFGATPFFIELPIIDILGIYPYWETLIPQFVVFLLAVLSILWIRARTPKGTGTPTVSDTPVGA